MTNTWLIVSSILLVLVLAGAVSYVIFKKGW